jgi:hypothetical protein
MENLITCIIIPNTFVEIYQIFNHITIMNKYIIHSIPIKVVDKYYYENDLFHKYYPYNMICHIFLKKNIEDKLDNIKNLCKDITVPINFIDQNPTCLIILKLLFEKISEKFFKNILNQIEFDNFIHFNENINKLINEIHFLNTLEITNIPSFIENIDEFFFWIYYIHNNIFLYFDSNQKFSMHYNIMTNKDYMDNIIYPSWINNGNKYKYSYLYIINVNENIMNIDAWHFNIIWNNTNNANKKTLSIKK